MKAVTLRKTQLAYEVGASFSLCVYHKKTSHNLLRLTCQTSLEALPPVREWTPEWYSRMENMDLPSLLNYRNSFVRSICNLLGLDPDEISGKFCGSHGVMAYSRILGKEFQEVCEILLRDNRGLHFYPK